ncbi:MAG: ACP S-malonyltransferase [Candidatus Kapaibacterium sp.]
MSAALLFSGQGSQYVGMIRDLYEKYPSVKEKIEIANEILGYSLKNICFEGPADVLKETRFTQPAIFLHSAAAFHIAADKLDYSAVAGHSVGEYAALYAAGVLDFETAIGLVSLRGKLMFQAGTTEPGTMFAVLGMDDDKVIEVCRQLSANDDDNVVVAANFNSPGQIVVSGSAQYLRDSVSAFKNAGAKLVKELIVSGAFHSPLMQPARDQLENAIGEAKFNDAKVPVYANVYAKPLTSADEIRKALVEQLTSPVLWTQTLRNMNENGIDKFIEIGPGNVLQGLTKRTLKDVEISGIDKAEDIEKLS